MPKGKGAVLSEAQKRVLEMGRQKGLKKLLENKTPGASFRNLEDIQLEEWLVAAKQAAEELGPFETCSLGWIQKKYNDHQVCMVLNMHLPMGEGICSVGLFPKKALIRVCELLNLNPGLVVNVMSAPGEQINIEPAMQSE